MSIEVFLTSNAWQYRLARTIVQGLIGVIVANLDLILGYLVIDPALRPMIVALCMAVLSPVMAELGKKTSNDDDLKIGGTE